MSQITILLLYLLAALALILSRLPRFAAQSRIYIAVAFSFAAAGLILHGQSLFALILSGHGISLSIGSVASMIALELALIAVVAAFEPALRGMSAGMLTLAAPAALLMGEAGPIHNNAALAWHVKAHILIALTAYGVLTVGAIVAVYALIQERRLHAARITAANRLFAPLETTEKLLIGVTATGFAGLTLAIATGLYFVNNLLEQHLAHKFALSLLAWIIFGVLLAGRFVAGWRGKRAFELYLWGFIALGLAYFGSRVILEQIFDRAWG